MDYQIQGNNCTGNIHATISGQDGRISNWEITGQFSGNAGNAISKGSFKATPTEIEGHLKSQIGGYTASNFVMSLDANYKLDGPYKIGVAGFARENFRGLDVYAGAKANFTDEGNSVDLNLGLNPTGTDNGIGISLGLESGLGVYGKLTW